MCDMNLKSIWKTAWQNKNVNNSLLSTAKVRVVISIETLPFLVILQLKMILHFVSMERSQWQTNKHYSGQPPFHICHRVLILTSEVSKASWIGTFEWIMMPLTISVLLVCCFLLTCWPLRSVPSTTISPSLQRHWNMCNNHCCYILDTSTHKHIVFIM